MYILFTNELISCCLQDLPYSYLLCTSFKNYNNRFTFDSGVLISIVTLSLFL